MSFIPNSLLSLSATTPSSPGDDSTDTDTVYSPSEDSYSSESSDSSDSSTSSSSSSSISSPPSSSSEFSLEEQEFRWYKVSQVLDPCYSSSVAYPDTKMITCNNSSSTSTNTRPPIKLRFTRIKRPRIRTVIRMRQPQKEQMSRGQENKAGGLTGIEFEVMSSNGSNNAKRLPGKNAVQKTRKQYTKKNSTKSSAKQRLVKILKISNFNFTPSGNNGRF